jgi:hypothetical protein
MHSVAPTARHAQNGSPNLVWFPSTTGLEATTVSMSITPPQDAGILWALQATTDDTMLLTHSFVPD